MRPRETSLTGVLTAVPWCCVLPAGLAVLGLAGAGAARMATVEAMPYLLGATAVLLGRAHYIVHVRRQGSDWSRRIVWASTFLAVAMWIPRLLSL